MRPGTILIADDEQIVHLTIQNLLEADGYAIDSAYTGQEVLGKLEHNYDLIILNIKMPDMEGIQVLCQIRKKELDIEIIILTGYATLETAAQSLNYGARAYLMKPIEDIAEFKTTIRRAMHLAQIARENRQSYEALASAKIEAVTEDGKFYQVPILREENKQIFLKLMEVLNEAIVFVDFDGNITFANLKFAQMIGELYQKLLKNRFESYLTQEDRDKVIEVFTKLSGGQVSMSIPAQLKTSTGHLLPVIINSSPIYFQGEFRGIVMVISDLTQINKVREKVELLANLVENALYDMMFILLPEGRIVECNSLVKRVFGYSQNKMLSMNIRDLLKIDEDTMWQGIMEAVEKNSRWRGELTAVSGDGKRFPVEMTLSRPVDKMSPNMICFMRDITEVKKAEKAKAEAQVNKEKIEQLEKELRSLEQVSRPLPGADSGRPSGSRNLRESEPGQFHELICLYDHLMDLALEKKAFKVEHDLSSKLCSLSERIGSMGGGPRDVVEIHTAALKKKTVQGPSQKAQAYAEEGRLMVLELMGHLVSYYREKEERKGVSP